MKEIDNNPGALPQSALHKHTNKLLNALSEINKEFIDPNSNKRALFKKLLNNALEVTESEYGFMGEVLLRDEKPYLKTYAITDISWNEETAAFYRQHEELGFEFTNLDTLFGHTLTTSEIVISNHPESDSRSGGRPAGHPALNHYLGIPIKDKNNTMIGMIGLANKPGGYQESDITFLEPMLSLVSAFIAAVKAGEAKEFFSDTLDSYKKAIDSHSIVSVTDTKGKLIYVNDNFCKQYQYTAAEMIGRDHRLINSGFHDKSFIQNLWETIQSGKIWKGEVKNKARDGRIYWENKTVIPFLDASGKPYQFISISNDITRLKEQEKELNNLFVLSEDFLIIANTSGYFLRVSHSLPVALGYTEEELLSRPFIDFVHPDDVDSTINELSSLSQGISTFNFINRYICKDGSVISLLWKASVSAEDGRVYATASDITKQQEADRKLLLSKLEMEKARTKDLFLSNMSHEIRTPLNAIMGFNSLLSNTPLNQEQKGYLETMTSALRNLNVIINDILDLSKLESGKVELEKRAFSLEETVKQVVQLNRVQAKAKHLQLLFSMDPFIPEKIIGDETRLSQILMNLLSNAIKFTNKGKVEVAVQEVEHSGNQITIQFRVSDTGIGIDPEKLELIFERFTQAENYTNRVFGGTGLGLNIVKMLIELHGGKMSIDSKVGMGTTFTFDITFSIPSKVISDSTPAQTSTLEAIPARILLVEDNFHNQQLACIYLERNGATVDVASDGLKAIELLQEQEYDVVIMDIQMPVMDGIEATEIIRNQHHNKVPIIGCSAHALTSEKRRCLEIGMNDYITKPYTERQLVQTVYQQLHAESADVPVEMPQEAPADADDISAIFQVWENDFGRDKMLVLVKGLQKRLPGDMDILQQSLDHNDTEKIRTVSHQLVGSLGSMQMMEGMRLARQAETIAAGDDKSTLGNAVSALIAYLETSLQQLQEIGKE